MTGRVKAWQCIGCGNIDAAQTCIGICDYRRVEFVHAQEHADALDAERRAHGQADALMAVVSRLAHTTPRDGEWQRGYLAMQSEARALLLTLATSEAGP